MTNYMGRPQMTGTNPGTWPDQGGGKLEYCPLCKVWHGAYCPVRAKDKYKLYTTADLKAAKLETVERVVKLVAETDYIPGAYQWDKFGEEIEKLKEEINAS